MASNSSTQILVKSTNSQTHAALLPLAHNSGPVSQVMNIPCSSYLTTFEVVEQVQHSYSPSSPWNNSKWPAEILSSSPTDIDNTSGDYNDNSGVKISMTGSDNNPTPAARFSEISAVKPAPIPDGKRPTPYVSSPLVDSDDDSDDEDLSLFQTPTAPKATTSVARSASLTSPISPTSFLSMVDPPTATTISKSEPLESQKKISSLLNSALANANAHLKDIDSQSIRPSHHPPRPSTSLSKHSRTSSATPSSVKTRPLSPSTATNQPTPSRVQLRKLIMRSRTKTDEISSCSSSTFAEPTSAFNPYTHFPYPYRGSIDTSSTGHSNSTSPEKSIPDTILIPSTIKVEVKPNEDVEFRSPPRVGKENVSRTASAVERPLPPTPESTSWPLIQNPSAPFAEYADQPAYAEEDWIPVENSHLDPYFGTSVKVTRGNESDPYITIVDCDEDKDISTNVSLRLAINRLRDLRWT